MGYPAWSSNSSYVDFWAPNKIKRVKVGNTRAEDFLSYSSKIFLIPEFGPWNDSAVDGSRMFVRDASTDDIYALDLELH